VIAGYLAARYLKVADAPNSARRRTALTRMALLGLLLAIAAYAWTPLFPMSKKLWSGSFVLLTVGLDLVVLAGLAAALEGPAPNPAARFFPTRFFQVFGRNPLAIYLFSELFVTTLQQIEVAPGAGVYDWVGVKLFQALAPGPVGALLCAIAYMLACWLLGYVLDRRRIILRL
jgi:predicted acyltransferase